MKYFLTLMIAFSACTARAQDTAAHKPNWQSYYKRHSTIITAAIGFMDNYRMDYSLPVGFQKSNTSGFAPISARVEYALTDHIGISAGFGYNAFQYNFKQEYTGNNGPFTRYRTNNTSIFSAGVAAYYHLDKFIRINRFDPFAGIGISLNNIRYSAFPQGDSTLTRVDHTVTPYLKVGGRYYISDKFSLFGDVGYEKQGVICIGFSCRFDSQKKAKK